MYCASYSTNICYSILLYCIVQRFTTLGLKIHNCLQCVMFWLHHLAGAMKKAWCRTLLSWSVVTLSPFFLRPGIPEFSQKFRVANENSSLYFQKCWVLTRKVCLKNGLYQNSRFWKNLKFSLSQILFAASWLQHVYGFRGAGPVGLACPRGKIGIKRNLGLIT